MRVLGLAATAATGLALATMPAALAAPEGMDGNRPPPLAEEFRRAEEMARQGVQQLLSSLDLLVRAIPQYGMPRMNGNGDIVIPRKRPPDGPPPVSDRPNRRAPPFNDGGNT
jgi:hypothetical protein